jgi:hypothetical protein
MIGIAFAQQIHLRVQATDIRKNFDGLVGIVTTELQKVRHGVFAFVNKRREKMKILL